ncbi:transcription factor hsf1 [Moniliophthora roreri MCA 2997]|uniref:Transcription factor hsf1 n=1 Tax=Moniliophthora roreri (strain MCA 2997) TaxID=1381753 RepID=V2XQS1_MONRO|nr:transcription factor hsf1 [Moniliophthora roreri MCA 2997]
MAPSRQITLANGYGATPAISPKVPMFLQKLYKIVSDSSTNDVICWSDTGDSFFVHDHERLAKEHLGNWFKHNKFASFVRQLNMYGFHKIPHLQQGVLRSDSDAEHSQFAHPDFHRGQEDRLIFIERKKHGTAQNAAGQQLDWHSIVNGITAIRRHQSNISQELNELKRSNQLLWQESMEARQRHQRQQDTINRIIKFLAGVFGQHVNASPREKDNSSPSHSVVPGPRLMIEDRKRGPGSGKVEITEVQDEENMSPVESRSRDPSPRMCLSHIYC